MLLILGSCQKDPFIQASVEMIEADYPGGDFEFSLQSNSAWHISLAYPPGGERYWAHVETSSGEKGTTVIKIHVDPSTQYSREANIVISSEDAPDYYQSIALWQQGKLDCNLYPRLSKDFAEFLAKMVFSEWGIVLYEDILNIKVLNLEGKVFKDWSDLAYLENLEELDISGCNLSDLDFLQHPKLRVLRCSDNSISQLDLSKFPELEELWCWNNQIKKIDISSLDKLYTLYCSGNPLEELVLNTMLANLSCSGCNLETLDLSGTTRLRDLDCSQNRIEYLNLANTKAYIINCDNNPLKTLLLPDPDIIEVLSCKKCELTGSLTVGKRIVQLDCQDNQLEQLVFRSAGELNELNCQNNRLQELTILDSPRMSRINCSGNRLTSVHLGEMGYLVDINCTGNLLQGLELPGALRIEYVSVQGNPGHEGTFELKVPEATWLYDFVDSWDWEGQPVKVSWTFLPWN